jgi:hypothetical protein
MKNIKELLEASKEDLPSVYCDMDQVLCDFLKGAEKVIGMPFPLADKVGRWKTITDTKDYWADLEWMPGAKKIVQVILKYDAHILSAFSGKDPNSKSGKMKWLSKKCKF